MPTQNEASVWAETLPQNVSLCALWYERFPPSEWALYRAVVEEAQRQQIPFAVGGGLASCTYSGHWRDSKDLDIYILEKDRPRLIKILSDSGLTDYYDQKPYDRKWIYRSFADGVIIDVMWAMANQRAQVDEQWFHGPEVSVGGVRFRLLPPEEIIWTKLYVMQRDRCDWPDVLSILYSMSGDLHWKHLIDRVGEDWQLLAALLQVFSWVCADAASSVPHWVWEQLRTPGPKFERPAPDRDRADLLDSRPWLAPNSEDHCRMPKFRRES